MSSGKENTRMCCLCGSQPSKDPSITLHRFPRPGPKNSLRCELWARYCFPDQDWSSPKFQNELYTKHKMLCSKHFLPTCFVEKKLFRTAVPNVGYDEDASINYVRLAAAPAVFIPDCGPSIVVPNAGPSRIVKPLGDHDVNIIQPEAQLNADIEKSKEKSKSLRKADEKNKILMRKMKNKMNKIYKLQKTIKHLKNESFINVLANNDTVKEVLEKKVSSTFALLLQSELQNYSRKTSGRRWNLESKIIALRLYKRSPTCYKLLRRMICLPAPSTLQFLLSKFSMNVGINQKLLNILRDSIKNYPKSDRELIIMWDEMSIRKNLWYNPKSDMIEGFQDHAVQGRSPQPATYALVFMVVGIRSRIKQPIAYYLSSGSVTADRLAVLIKEVVNSCFDARLNISASVCDMDGVNKKALGILGGSVENPIIEVGNHKIVSLFDTPHLLKCFRNLFLKHDIKFMTNISSDDVQGIGIAKWSHIRQFYELDNSNPNFVYAPSLTKDHLDPNSKQRMKVNLAAQVLSHSVAGGMYSKISDGDMSTEALATANLISNIDDLYDSVNANTPHPRRGKKYSTNIKINTDHINLFNKMKTIFKKMEFMGCRRNPPSKEGWVWTINGIQLIWSQMKKYKNVESLATRRLQQDPLENLFGCIRTNCGANSNPTVSQFVAALKTAVMSNLAHTGSGNCELDDNEPIIMNFKKLLTPKMDTCKSKDTEQASMEEDQLSLEDDDEITTSLEENFEGGSSEIQACAYVCGFIIKNNKNECNTCKNIFIAQTREEVHNFIDFKKYESLRNSLIYASKDFIDCVEKSAILINKFLEKQAYEPNLKSSATGILKKNIKFDFLLNCAEHKDKNIKYIMNSVFHICIKRYCILKNRKFSEEASKSALKRKIDILKHK